MDLLDVAHLIDDGHELSVVVTTLSRHNITFDGREGPNRPQLVIWTKPAPKPSAMPLRLRR